MLFVVAGILKPDVEERMISLRNEWSEHLSQPFRRISLAGLMRDREGKRQGYLIFFEAENFDDAQAYLHQSPFYRNNLYERVDVAEFNAQIGYIERAEAS
jgi:uncharacterized protein YciI